MIIEICANSFESAKAAQEAGANRIELCSELSVGGITPSHGLIEKVISELDIPVHVLIRPRSGDFTYSQHEMDVMLKDIAFCRKMGCAGIVSGILNSENEIDFQKTRQLIIASKQMEFTFHRAFDWCPEPFIAIKVLRELKVTRLLSSGQNPKAIDGIDLLKKLNTVAEKEIQIMPGGGINIDNALLFKKAGFEMIHFSATQKKQLLANKPKVPMHNAILFNEGVIAISDKKTIQKIMAILS